MLERVGLIHDFEVDNRGGFLILVSDLLFANDSLLFCKAKEEMRRLRGMFCFEDVSVLHINLAMCVVIGVGALENMDSLLGCQVDSLSIAYVGMPLTFIYLFIIIILKVISIWNVVVE